MIPDALLAQTTRRFPRFEKGEVCIEPLEKGGSGRKFYRIAIANDPANAQGGSIILVRYTDQRAENRHYCDIGAFLMEVGVSIPSFYHHDPEAGLIWMEDLGEDDLWTFRDAPWEVRYPLYQQTLREVARLHLRSMAALEQYAGPLTFQQSFDADLYRWEQQYFIENCLQRHFGLSTETLRTELQQAALDTIAERLAALPRVLVHRDFQSQNIMVCQGRDPQVCFIDFQGMRPGLGAYDVASLLYDPYVSLSSEERAWLLGDYATFCEEGGHPVPTDFPALYDLCAMQRLMQALGAYGFLGLTQGRPDFLRHIPAALASLREVVGRVPGLERLHRLLVSLPA